MSQPSPSLNTWFTLNAADFQKYQLAQNAQRLVPAAASPAADVPSPINNFRSAIKINLNEYVKLKEDSQWRFFNRQLRATAPSHDTMDVLDPTCTAPSSDAAVFEQKQCFMYNVFSQCILTSK
jgi:hypothetical protein